MSLADTFKLFVTVTDAVDEQAYKIDIAKISVIFSKGFHKCPDFTQSILRYSNGNNKNTERSVLETPEAIEALIEKKQLDLLGSKTLLKAFISVCDYEGDFKAKIAVDAITYIAPPSMESEAKSDCYYKCVGMNQKYLKVLETQEQLEQQIEDKQRDRMKYMKIMMGNAIF